MLTESYRLLFYSLHWNRRLPALRYYKRLKSKKRSARRYAGTPKFKFYCQSFTQLVRLEPKFAKQKLTIIV